MNFLFKKEQIRNSIFLLVIFPAFSFANINFSEIMFDPEGTDANREWVEIINTSNVSVNLEKYKFCDSGSCHTFYSKKTHPEHFNNLGSDFKIPGNSYGIITKDPKQFEIDYPNFNGFILRSSFSINNNGELLELKDENKNIVSIVEYNSEFGGKNGDTFSLIGDTWKNGKATPGGENVFKEIITEEDSSGLGNSSGSSQDIERTYVEISDVIDGKKKLKAEIIDNIPTLIAGAENEFNGRAYGITGVEIKGAEYFWTLGDGKKEYGKNIKHTFLYPGEYVLTLIVKSSSFTGNIRKVVTVVNPPLEISEIDWDKNWVKIKNNYSDILKLDSWYIFSNGEKFKIPKETYILGKSEVIFPNKITHLDILENGNTFLLFPDGKRQSKFVKKSEVAMVVAAPPPSSEIKKTDVKTVKKAVGKIVKNIKKKVNNFASQNYSKTSNTYFDRNFLSEENNILEKDEIGEKGNFAKQNLLPDNLENIKTLSLKKDRNFIKENMYFILFILLIGGLVLISFLLNHFKNKDIQKDEIESEAEEFEVEEIN